MFILDVKCFSKEVSHTNKQLAIKKRNAVVGAIAVIIVLLLAVFLARHFYKPAAVPLPNESNAGVVSIGRILKAHPQYADLEKLYDERAAITEKMHTLSNDSLGDKTDAENDKAAFEEFAQQKNSMGQQIINKKLQSEMTDKEAALRKQIADNRAEDIKEISDEYRNEIFNCSLKLDNASNLRLSSDDVDQLNAQIVQLKKERAEKVRAVLTKYNDYIEQQLGEYYSQQLNDLQGKVGERDKQNNEQISQAAAEFQQKRADMLKEQTEKINSRKKAYFDLLKELDDKDSEIDALREMMIRDISMKASKVAAMYQLDIIYIDSNDSSDEMIFGNDDLDEYFKNLTVPASSVRDVTDAIIEQMQDAG